MVCSKRILQLKIKEKLCIHLVLWSRRWKFKIVSVNCVFIRVREKIPLYVDAIYRYFIDFQTKVCTSCEKCSNFLVRNWFFCKFDGFGMLNIDIYISKPTFVILFITQFAVIEEIIFFYPRRSEIQNFENFQGSWMFW